MYFNVPELATRPFLTKSLIDLCDSATAHAMYSAGLGLGDALIEQATKPLHRAFYADKIRGAAGAYKYALTMLVKSDNDEDLRDFILEHLPEICAWYKIKLRVHSNPDPLISSLAMSLLEAEQSSPTQQTFIQASSARYIQAATLALS